MTPVTRSTEWMADAACRGANPEVWFPTNASGKSRRSRFIDADIEYARSICIGCPVREDCLSYARATGELQGIWGGLLPEERGAPAADLRRCDRCGSVFVARNRLHGLCGAGPCRQGYKTAHQRATRERNL